MHETSTTILEGEYISEAPARGEGTDNVQVDMLEPLVWSVEFSYVGRFHFRGRGALASMTSLDEIDCIHPDGLPVIMTGHSEDGLLLTFMVEMKLFHYKQSQWSRKAWSGLGPTDFTKQAMVSKLDILELRVRWAFA